MFPDGLFPGIKLKRMMVCSHILRYLYVVHLSLCHHAALPTNTHPSYPFGNPYSPTSASRFLPSHTFVTKHSLATNLAALELPKGMPQAERKWADLGLDKLLPLSEILDSRKEELDFNQAADQVAREGSLSFDWGWC